MGIQSVKKNWVWIALACTLAASAWTALNEGNSGSDDNLAETLSAPTASAQPSDRSLLVAEHTSNLARQQGDSLLNVVGRAQINNEPQDMFEINHSLQERVLTQPPVPVAPQIPPLPFLYAGKLFEDGQYTVFMIEGDRNLAVTIGDVIDKVWRIKSIRPPKMILSYLPLKMDAVLDIGESN